MKFLLRMAAVLALLASAQTLRAQMPSGASGLKSVVLKLFGNHDDFSVDADFEMIDAKQVPVLALTMGITVSGVKLRADADLNSYKGPGVTPEIKAQILTAKKMGVDHTVSITRPDKNRMFQIYPGRKSYEDFPLPKEAATVSAIAKITKTPLGRETIDGHPCVKNKVVLIDAKGHQQEMTDWEASDLKDFPIVVKLVEDGQDLVVHNRNIRLGKPDASVFEIPAGYTKATR